MKILYILLILFSPACVASEMYVSVASKHFDSDYDYNQINPGIFYKTDRNIFFGIFRNSYSDPTIIFGRMVSKIIDTEFRLQLGYGLTYGYGYDNGKTYDADEYGKSVVPMLLPTVGVKIGDVWLNTHVIEDSIGLSFSHTF